MSQIYILFKLLAVVHFFELGWCFLVHSTFFFVEHVPLLDRRGGRWRGEDPGGSRRRCVEGLLWRGAAGYRGRVRHALWRRVHIPGHDVSSVLICVCVSEYASLPGTRFIQQAMMLADCVHVWVNQIRKYLKLVCLCSIYRPARVSVCVCWCYEQRVGLSWTINSMQISLSHLMRKDDLSPQRFPGCLIGSLQAGGERLNEHTHTFTRTGLITLITL